MQSWIVFLLGIAEISLQVTCNEMDPTFVARKWAPEVRLAVGEEWLPSSVDYFLQYVDLHGASSASPLTVNNIPECNTNCYLQTKNALKCNSCTNLAFLHGQNPSTVPVYAAYETNSTMLTIKYLFFYPYNRGKRVCIGIFDSKKRFLFGLKLGCIGAYSTFAHHVGDWEDITLTFQQNGTSYVPVKLTVPAHSFETQYFWNGHQFAKGPDNVSMTENTHSIIYSADGSHGHWIKPGDHRYMNLPNGHYLVDKCSEGQKWKTWNDLKIVQKGNYQGEFNFLKFKGRWGNIKQGCGIIEYISDECMLNSGPKIPRWN